MNQRSSRGRSRPLGGSETCKKFSKTAPKAPFSKNFEVFWKKVAQKCNKKAKFGGSNLRFGFWLRPADLQLRPADLETPLEDLWYESELICVLTKFKLFMSTHGFSIMHNYNIFWLEPKCRVSKSRLIDSLQYIVGKNVGWGSVFLPMHPFWFW